MASTIYQRFLFGRFCSSAAENLDLRLAKHQQVCLVNECSHMEEYVHLLARTSFNIKLFVRFCIRLGLEVDLRFSSKQLLCLHKECIKVAQYYDDKEPMKQAILSFVSLSKSVSRYEDQNECEEVIAYGKKCIDIAREMGVKQIEMDACYVVGRTCLGIKHFQDAVLYCKRSLEIAMETSDRESVMHASLKLGRAYAGLQQYADAICNIKNCIEVSKETGNREVEMYAQLDVGRAYAKLKDYENAIIFCKRSIEIAKATGNREVEICAHLEVGRAFTKILDYEDENVYYNLCNHTAKGKGGIQSDTREHQKQQVTHVKPEVRDDAIFHGMKCANIAKEIGDRKTEEAAYHTLETIYNHFKQYDEAIACGKKRIEIAKQFGDESVALDSYIIVAIELWLARQYEESVEYGAIALEISTQTCDSNAQMFLYLFLGKAYKNLKQSEKSIFFLKKCIEKSTKYKDKLFKMRAHFQLVEVFVSVPLLDEATLHLNKGKSIAQELNRDEFINRSRDLQCVLDVIVGINNHFLPNEQDARELLGLDILGSSEQDLLDAIDKTMTTKDVIKQTEALLRHYCFCHSKKEYEKALSSLKSLKKLHLDEVSNLWIDRGILKLHMIIQQFDKALAYCWEILSETKESGDKVHQSLFYSMFGQLLYLHDQWDDAEKYLRESLQCFEIVFISLCSDDKFKISIIDKYFDCYKCLSLVLSVTNQVDEALLVSDGCRARALRDLLVENFGMKKEEKEENQLDIQAFLESCNCSTVLFYSLFSDGVLLFFSETNENTFKLVFQQYEMCEKSTRNFLNLIDHVFDKLDARQVSKCENRSLDVNQDETERRDEKEELISDVLLGKNASQCTTAPDSRGERSEDLDIHGNVLKCLYKNLISPTKDYLDKDEVIIIPEGPLNCVPFAALQNPDTGKYLSETKRIRLAPSIATLKVLQERPDDEHHEKGALVIGSPLVQS